MNSALMNVISNTTMEALYWYCIFVLHSPKLLLLLLTNFQMPSMLESYLATRTVPNFPSKGLNYWQYVLVLLNNISLLKSNYSMATSLRVYFSNSDLTSKVVEYSISRGDTLRQRRCSAPFIRDTNSIIDIVIQVIKHYNVQHASSIEMSKDKLLCDKGKTPHDYFNFAIFSGNFRINPFDVGLLDPYRNCTWFNQQEFVSAVYENCTFEVIRLSEQSNCSPFGDLFYTSTATNKLCCCTKGNKVQAVKLLLNDACITRQKVCPHVPLRKPQAYDLDFGLVHQECMLEWRK